MLPGRLADMKMIPVEPLTPQAFSGFGFVIENPDEHGSYTLPQHVQASSANQGTAKKYGGMSPLSNGYDAAPEVKSASSVFNLFVCSSRPLLPLENNDEGESSELQGQLELTVMERHPYTTQTFIPMGLDVQDKTTAFLVIVAPTMKANPYDSGIPDTANMKAFLASGSQAVTYGAGTWHAPMIVIGRRPVSFVVVQYVNGVVEDDCEEIDLGSNNGAIRIVVSKKETSMTKEPRIMSKL